MIDRYKPRRERWVRGPCFYEGCRKASVWGNLCGPHQEVVKGEQLAALGYAGLVLGFDTKVAITGDGYVRIKTPSRTRGAHQLAMEAMLGRSLLPGENVHHINGVRWDNHPDNLELWVSAQPSGQRPGDLAAYARRLLSLYGTAEERQEYAPQEETCD